MLANAPLVAFVITLLFVSFPPSDGADAQDGIAVDSTDDRPDTQPGNGICDDGSGFCTLRAAVMEANALPGPDEIHVPAGTYVLSFAGAGEDASLTGDLDLTDAVTIIGAGSDTTIIDGAGLDRMLHHPVFGGAAPLAVVSGVTLRNGGGDLSAGGAVYNAGRLELHDVAIADSTADFSGGGIMNEGNLSISGGTIGPGNDSLFGGGIFNFGVGSLTDSTIDGNEATNQGGGLYNFGVATVTGSTFSENSAATHGGGIVNDGGMLTITNSTVSGNTAATGGGGIANGNVLTGFRLAAPPDLGPIEHPTPAELSALNVTLAANSAGAGGNLLHVAGSTATLQNTLVGGAGSGGDCSGAIASLGHNLDSDGTCGLSAPGDISEGYAAIEPLADNGGPTQTHALVQQLCSGDACIVSSDAIDNGDNQACPAADQRGQPRPIDGGADGVATCDIGAYERQEGPVSDCPPNCGVGPGPTATPSPAPSPTPSAALPVALPRSGGTDRIGGRAFACASHCRALSPQLSHSAGSSFDNSRARKSGRNHIVVYVLSFGTIEMPTRGRSSI